MIRNGTYKNCIICSKAYYIRADRAEKSKYCSQQCWAKRRILKLCEECEKPIVSYYNTRFCSKECSVKVMVGEKASKWKDGKSLERDRARLSNELTGWRNKVFERDNYTCQKCGINKELHAHHVIEWAKSESKRFDLDNGMTLCVDCHGEIHNKNFRKSNKKCIDCGKKVKVKDTRCRSCSTRNYWKNRKSLIQVLK